MRQTAYNVHSFHLLGDPGLALTLADLKQARSENLRQKTGRAMIVRPMQGCSSNSALMLLVGRQSRTERGNGLRPYWLLCP